MTDEPENHTLRLLREMREQIDRRFDALDLQVLLLSNTVANVREEMFVQTAMLTQVRNQQKRTDDALALIMARLRQPEPT